MDSLAVVELAVETPMEGGMIFYILLLLFYIIFFAGKCSMRPRCRCII